MFVTRWWKNTKKIYHEYPRQFWILVGSLLIDKIGGALIFPFLMLYITKKFSAGMTEVGLIFGLFAISGMVGNILGGALTDRFGRKGMIIFGLVVSALVNVGIGLATSMAQIYLFAVLLGPLSNAGGPARQAMVADLLPEEQRAQGFGILRVVNNLAAAIGPAIGGLLAASSYLLLFLGDAVTSIITAGIVAMAIRDTKPQTPEGQAEETVVETFGGYRDVFRDYTFMLFIGACVLAYFVYLQMSTTLGVYLRDIHFVSEQGYGALISVNATMVVFFQFAITRWTARYKPLTMMAVGTLLSAIGFGMYGIVGSYALFLVAMVIVTIGEMLAAPHPQALASRFAPDHMRGRYMAVGGFSSIVPVALGPLLTGLVMDNFDQRWLWFVVAVAGILATVSFVMLQRSTEQRQQQAEPAVVSV